MGGRETGDNDFPVALHCHSSGLGFSAAEIRSHFAGFIKADVRRSIRVEARDCKSSVITALCVTGDDNLAVTLHSDTAAVVDLTKVGGCFTGPVEGRIETSICVISRDCEIVIAGGKRLSRDHNLSILLQSHAICTVGAASDSRGDLPRFA